MQFQRFQVIKKLRQAEDIFLFRLKPINQLKYHFVSGQYCTIKNPLYKNPQEHHIFSIASTPNDNYLEFCIRILGNWTKDLSKILVGQQLDISEPQGDFLWKNSDNVVFLAGGVGISSIISILKDIYHKQVNSNITLIYCCRTIQTAIYKEEILQLQEKFGNFKSIFIFSEQKLETNYFGFLSKEIILKEVEQLEKSRFYISGPAEFIKLTRTFLDQLKVNINNIHDELDIRNLFTPK